MSTRAERQRSYRRRQAREVSVYRIPAHAAVLAALLVSGRLTEADALDRCKVEAELSAVLAEWAARWADEKNRYA